MLLPASASQAVSDGTIIASPKERPKVVRYRDSEHLYELFANLSRSGKKAYFTVYILIPGTADISPALSMLGKNKATAAGMTVLVNSPLYVPSASQLQQISQCQNVQVLVSGSFYRTLGSLGGSLAVAKC
jgi:hypothetical protein